MAAALGSHSLRAAGVGRCDSPAARRTAATPEAAKLCARGSQLHGSGLGRWRRVVSAPLPGSISSAAYGCGMRSGSTSARHSFRSGAHWFAGNRCARHGEPLEADAIFPFFLPKSGPRGCLRPLSGRPWTSVNATFFAP